MERLFASWWREVRGTSLPQLYYERGSNSEALLEQCPRLHRYYTPPLCARNKHVHLIISGVLRKWFINAKYKRQLLTAPDGGVFAIDWFRGSNKKKRLPPDAPIVLVVHALCGDSSDAFVKWICLAFYKLGWRAVSFNYRGCGGVPLTTPKIFCQADTSDIYESVKEIRLQYPEAPIFAAGFSLGGYTLNKYVGQVDTGVYGPEGKLDGVACLGSGYDFKAEMALGEESSGLSYNLIILHYWKDYVQKHRRMLVKGGIDLTAVKRARSLPELDKILACKIYGYRTVGELYDDSNGTVWIPRIRTPCLLISADDDPFLDPVAKPTAECKQSAYVIFCSTRYGSHCAHLRSWWPYKYSWLDCVVPEFFGAILAQKDGKRTDGISLQNYGSDDTEEGLEANADHPEVEQALL